MDLRLRVAHLAGWHGRLEINWSTSLRRQQQKGASNLWAFPSLVHNFETQLKAHRGNPHADDRMSLLIFNHEAATLEI